MCDCDDYDMFEPVTYWDGIHYYDGARQPFFPELAPIKPILKEGLNLAQVDAIFIKNMERFTEIWNKEDMLFQKLSKLK